MNNVNLLLWHKPLMIHNINYCILIVNQLLLKLLQLILTNMYY